MLVIILNPVYTKHLSAEMYGTWALIISCAAIAGVVCYLGVTSALARSFYDYPDLEGRKRVVNTSLLLTCGGGVVQIVLGWAFRRPLSAALFGTEAYATHLAIALSGAAFGFVNQLFYVVLRFQRRSKAVVILNLVSLVAGGGLIVYLLLGAKMGLMAPVLGEAINQAITCVALACCAREWLGLSFSRQEARVQLLYGLATVCNGLIYYLYTMGDRFLIKRFCELSDVGVYSLGARVGMLIQVVLILPFAQIWTPMRMEMRDKPGSPEFFGRVLTYYVLIGSAMALGLTLFAPEAIALLAARPGYAFAAKIVPLVVFAQLIYGVVGIVDAGIIFSRRIYLTTLVAFVALAVNWVSNFLLLPRIGVIGAGISLLLSMTVFMAGIFTISNRLFAINIELSRICALVGLAVGGLLAGLEIPASMTAWTVGLKFALVTIIAWACHRFVLNDKERAVMGGVARRAFAPLPWK